MQQKFYCKQTFRFYQNSQQGIITLLYTYRGFSQLDPERHQQVTLVTFAEHKYLIT